MKLKVALFLMVSGLSALSSAGVNDTKTLLTQIGQNADVGNGSWDVKTYDVSTFDVTKAIASDLKEAQQQYPKCGKYSTIPYRRDSIKEIGKAASDNKTVDALSALYKQGKIAKMYAIHNDMHNIDCAQLWVEVYTTDGFLLEINYGEND